jgi:rhamnogalacturonyl hydrolase YesR
MRRAPVAAERWSYDAGLVLLGLEAAWRVTGDAPIIAYVERTIDGMVDADGAIRGYRPGDHVLDDVNMGKVLFPLLARATDARARARWTRALGDLRAGLRAQPRTADGGFWHKGIYPHQMWLDGVYMAAPLLAQAAAALGEPAALDEAIGQVLLAEAHLRDGRTGLLYHGWDESRSERWADPVTGRSSQFWGRGVGWYAMAVVDVLAETPAAHPRRAELLAVLRRLAAAVAEAQDPATGVWWQVLDAPGRAGNFPEASASAMLVYALSKGVRNGWLDAATYGPVAARGYQGVLDRFVTVAADGTVSVGGICKVAGLGGKPYRDGSYAYYTTTEVVADDPKGVGAFILASAERALAPPSPPPAPPAAAPPATFDVRAYGAASDGKTKSTEAVRRAVAAAVAAGGGTVVFPAGQYLTGPIRLASNVTLQVDTGAVVRFSPDFDDYLPMVRSRWEGTEVVNFSPLIYVDGAENVAIRGRGVLDGQGEAWWRFWKALKDGRKKTGAFNTDSRWQKEFARANPGLGRELPEDPETLRAGFLRPPFIQLLDCKNVSIEDVTIRDSPFWTIHPVTCDGVSIRGVTIDNPPTSPNTDGIDPESCRNVRIADSQISAGDDCIAIKSGRDRQGRRIGRPAENTTITNCTLLRGHGGVVIGSEMSGGVRGVAVSGCALDGTDRGVRIKSARGRGGTVEDVRVSGLVMRNVRQEAIVVSLLYGDAPAAPAEPVSERTPRFRNIHIGGIAGEAGQIGLVAGLPESPVEDLTLADLDLRAQRGLVITDARRVAVAGARLDTAAGPALSAARVSGLSLTGVSTGAPHPRTPVLELAEVAGAFVHGCMAAPGTDLFVQVRGAGSSRIVVDGNDLVDVRTPVAIAPESRAGVVYVSAP